MDAAAWGRCDETAEDQSGLRAQGRNSRHSLRMVQGGAVSAVERSAPADFRGQTRLLFEAMQGARVWMVCSAQANGEGIVRPRKTILLVGVNEQSTSVQKFLLETRGYRVLLAQDGDAALALHALGVDL